MKKARMMPYKPYDGMKITDVNREQNKGKAGERARVG